ncbi:Alpha/Beta hydrolase protein [Xylariales sp. PMI_506]|nr:Alpha/Beta hydrolase protein [Xylariales sp. PMI_506]
MLVVFLILSTVAAGALALVPRTPHGSCGDGLTVRTTSGELHGFVNSTAPNTRQFLGVPYAEPPLGSLRFQPPRRKQGSSALDDCLYLNIYAPLHPVEGSLPVFIYIPGGGFTSGGANSLYKIPDQWISRTQAHIVITINYRVNVFGFPAAAGSHLNLGLLDQRMVVEWARDNVAAFGGDPERMVLWGQSAGAMSASYYAYGWYRDPIVKGLIADSGAAGNLGFDRSFSNFTALAGLVGCSGGDAGFTAEEELECVQGVDADTIQHIVSTTSGLSFGPRADNVTMYSDLAERTARGLVADLPMINGNNNNEGAGFSPSSGETQSTWQVGLNAITCPVSSAIALRTDNNLTTYRYYYAGNFSNISPEPWIGASHSAELPLIFGTHYEYRTNSTEFEWEVSYAMEAFWLSFARNPRADPVAGDITWPKYSRDANTTVYLAADDQIAQLINGSTVDDLCPTSICPTCAYFDALGS